MIQQDRIGIYHLLKTIKIYFIITCFTNSHHHHHHHLDGQGLQLPLLVRKCFLVSSGDVSCDSTKNKRFFNDIHW